MKSYVNKIVLLWSCCIIGFAFAVDQVNVIKNVPEVKITTEKVVSNNGEKEMSPVMQLSSEDAILAEKERHRRDPLNHLDINDFEIFEMTPNTNSGSRANHVVTVCGTVDSFPSEGGFGLYELYNGSIYNVTYDDGTSGMLSFSDSGETVCFTATLSDSWTYVVGAYDSYGDGGTDVTATNSAGVQLASVSSGDEGMTFSDPFVPNSDGPASCDDDTACNYGAAEDCAYPEAGLDCSGACVNGADLTTLTVGGGSFCSEVSWTLSDGSSGGCGTFSLCLEDGDYTFSGCDSYGDSWNGNTAVFSNTDGDFAASNGPGSELDAGDCLDEVITIGAVVTPGCTDINAPNYNADATIDDGSCEDYCNSDVLYSCAYYLEYGTGYTCEVLTGYGYDCSLCEAEGVCPVPGCTDSGAYNYNPDATLEDNTCIYPCEDETACNFGANENCEFADDGFNCDGDCIGTDSAACGCTDFWANNYDSSALSDPSSCDYTGRVSAIWTINAPASYASEVRQLLCEQGGTNCLGYSSGLTNSSTAVSQVYLVDGQVYEMYSADSYGDGWTGGGSWSVVLEDGTVLASADEAATADYTTSWTVNTIQPCTAGFDCAGTCGGTVAEDCAGDCGGTAAEDCAGTCNGDAVVDCAGECNGSASEDNCGTCDADASNDCVADCNGVYEGEEGYGAVEDECGVCEGPGSIYECGCSDIAEGACDCAGNVLDDCLMKRTVVDKVQTSCTEAILDTRNWKGTPVV